jgi:hypothetical protein
MVGFRWTQLRPPFFTSPQFSGAMSLFTGKDHLMTTKITEITIENVQAATGDPEAQTNVTAAFLRQFAVSGTRENRVWQDWVAPHGWVSDSSYQNIRYEWRDEEGSLVAVVELKYLGIACRQHDTLVLISWDDAKTVDQRVYLRISPRSVLNALFSES